MKKRLKDVEKNVERILTECPDTRSSDMLLYRNYCCEVNPYAVSLPFAEVIVNLEALRLPAFESVRRARQKIQARREDLRAADEVEIFRAENEAAYTEFAVS